MPFCFFLSQNQRTLPNKIFFVISLFPKHLLKNAKKAKLNMCVKIFGFGWNPHPLLLDNE